MNQTDEKIDRDEIDRDEIARRHRLPAELAAELRGTTRDELEADAAARAAVARILAEWEAGR